MAYNLAYFCNVQTQKHPMLKFQLFLTIGFFLFSAVSLGQDEKSWWKGLFSKEVTEKNIEPTEKPVQPVIAEPASKDTINEDTAAKSEKDTSETRGSVTWTIPAKVELLNDSLTKNPGPVKGYRVVIFSGTLEAAKKIRSEFVLKNPEMPCYLQHSAPNFEVRTGNYREKSQAFQLLSSLKTTYLGAYVTEDEIDLPTLIQLPE